jgi:hypothetical protein
MQRAGRRAPCDDPAMVRGRRRRRAVGATLLVVLLCYLGVRHGAGLFPSPAGGAAGPAVVEEGAAAEPPVTEPPVAEPPVTRAPAAGPPVAGSPVTRAPAVESSAAEPPAAPAPVRAATADQLWGNLRVMVVGGFDEAFAAAADALELELDPAQRAEVAAARHALEQRVRGAFDRALAEARAGEVLAAVQVLRGGVAAARAEPRALLAAAFAALDLPVPAGPTPAWTPVALPVPAPLARGAPVRVAAADGTLFDATVRDDRGDEVTVQRSGPRGLTFPTVDRAAIEPRSADPELAVAQLVSALRAGDPVLAVGWLARARALGAAADELEPLAAALLR